MSDCGPLGLLRPILDESEVQDAQRKIREKEERLKDLLGPIEPSLLAIQSVLVWEKPKRSVVVLLLANAMFWLAATTSYRTFFLVCFIATVFVFSEAWRTRIWPEIRVKKPQAMETEGWVPVHPHLMCAPEIGKYLAEIWVAMSYYCSALWHLRQEQPGLFCILVSLSCLGTAVLGHYISGFTLLYITVMCVLLWPCVFYHNLLQEAYIRFEPLMMRLEYKMKIKRKRSRRSRKAKKRPTDLSQDSAETESESDLEKFAPDPNPEATAALARAITDSEDETSSVALTPTRRLSREPSVGYSDDDISDQELNENSMLRGIHEMPSFETLDDNESIRSFLPSQVPSAEAIDTCTAESNDSLSTLAPGSMMSISSYESRTTTQPAHAQISEEAAIQHSDQIKFVSSHFQNSSESEPEGTVDHLSQGLSAQSFPDPLNVDYDSGTTESNQNIASAIHSQVMTAYATGLFNSVVSSTLAGLGKLGQSVSTVAKERLNRQTTASASDKSSLSRKNSQESDLADFEFLNEEDFGVDEKE